MGNNFHIMNTKQFAMKKLTLIGLSLTGFFVLLFITSCNSGNNNTNTHYDSAGISSMDSAANLNATKFGRGSTKGQNAQYLMKVYASGVYNIRASQLMLQHSKNEAVKKLADSLITINTRLNKRTADLAAKKQISLPDGLAQEQQQLLTVLKKDAGRDKDFNENYLRQMVNDHKNVITVLNQAQQSNDPDIIRWSDSILPEIQDHLEEITTVQSDIDSLQLKQGQR